MNEPECPSVEHLLAHATAAIGDATLAALWLDTQLPVLLGRTPRETARTPEGWRLVREVLGQIEHGIYS